MVQEHCLNEETLANYLEGSLEAPVRTAAEEHLVSCDGCRSQLVYYMRILDEDVREDEEPVLEAAMGRWGEGAAPVPERRETAYLKWGGLAAAVLVAATLGVFFGGYLWDSSDIEIARVLESRRPFEARLDVQSYTEYTATRDAQAVSPTGQYQELVARLMREGRDYQAGVYSLHDRNFDLAIDLLTEAVLEDGQAPERHNDLGVAYLERTGGNSEDRVLARERFEAALDLDADYIPAVFNLALLYEREAYDAEGEEQEQFYDDARAQQERYLELDPDSDWAEEIRRARSTLESAFGDSSPSPN